jgi:hypothetical protein
MIDHGIGQVGQVAQRLVLDGAVLAVAAPQQMGAVDLAVVLTLGSNYVGGSGAGGHSYEISGLHRQKSALLRQIHFSDYKHNPKKPGPAVRHGQG